MARRDFDIENHTSLYLVIPRTARARSWLQEHTDPSAMWFAGGLAVESRYVSDLTAGMLDAGFNVGDYRGAFMKNAQGDIVIKPQRY